VTKQSYLGRVEALGATDPGAPEADGPRSGADELAAVERAVRQHVAAIGATQAGLTDASDAVRALQAQLDDAREAAGEWAGKAMSMRRRSEEARVADRPDEAARLAAIAESDESQQREHERQAEELQAQLAAQQQSVAMTRARLTGLQDRFDELQQLRRTLARGRRS
jgi:uncharacterized coiled-coil protein SlyX